MFDTDSILSAFKKGHHPSLSLNELKKILKTHPHEMPHLRRLMRKMVKEGQLVRLKKGEFALPLESGLVTGTLQMNPKGFGFVRPLNQEEDIYIHRENISSGMDGDQVLISLISRARREGRIVKVLARANEHVVGTLEKAKKIFFVIPDNPRLIDDIIIPESGLRGAHGKDKVVVKITQWPSKHLGPQGEVTEILGESTDPKLDSIFIARAHGLSLHFPKEVEKEALSCHGSIPLRERPSRWDLRNLSTFTIDPEDARDFDDALSVEKSKEGWQLGIHIADVSFYVPQDSNMDREALQRGCTVYFTDRAIRMLPEKLSREICSLEEGKDRLAKSLFVELDQEGNVIDWKLGKSIIRSKRRFSYEEVTDILLNPGHHKLDPDLLESLFELERLTKVLFLKRLERGALELDIPEFELCLDAEGRVTSMQNRSKEISHRLVEECMLLANQLIANLLTEKGMPGLYRIHESPSHSDQEGFKKFIYSLGISLKSKFNSKNLQTLIEQFKNKPVSSLVNIALLRSLKVAQYSPKNLGHFALALESYTHFTSPIRRYPDLFIHQVIDQYFFSESRQSPRDLSKISKHCSDRERVADEVEREFNELKRLRFLKERLEEGKLKPSHAIVIDVKEYGIFVREENTLAEGLIHVSSLRDDFYIFDPHRLRLQGRRTRRQFRFGDQIRVRIVDINLYKKQIDFELMPS